MVHKQYYHTVVLLGLIATNTFLVFRSAWVSCDSLTSNDYKDRRNVLRSDANTDPELETEREIFIERNMVVHIVTKHHKPTIKRRHGNPFASVDVYNQHKLRKKPGLTYLVEIFETISHDTFSDMKIFRCTGGLISTNSFLTSALCLQRVNLTQGSDFKLFSVLVGSVHFEDNTTFTGGQWKTIDSLHFHTHFHDLNDPGEQDIALVTIKPSIVISSDVSILTLSHEQVTETHTNCSVQGWKLFQRNKSEEWETLLYTTSVIDYRTCSKLYRKFIPLYLMCAEPAPRDHGCEVDPGTPLVCGGLMFGIKVGATLCGSLQRPSMYADIGYHKDWLNKIEELNNDNNSGINYCVFSYFIYFVLSLLHFITKFVSI